jgi:hypothetical protein
VPSRARHHVADCVSEHVPVDDVGESTFEAAHGFHVGLAGRGLVVEVRPFLGELA